MQESARGTLYVVATPIGNLGDITLRAVEVLRAAAVIACEDTRVTAKLLRHYDIATPTIACHHHTSEERLQHIVARMVAGADVALVSDAGTPGVSDPGNALVARALAAGIAVVPVPGASALCAIVSVAGCDMQKFCFLGYPPHKKGRQTFFCRIAALDIPAVYYDSVHRVVKNLALLAQHCPGAGVIVGRELTKAHEHIVRATVEDAVAFFTKHPDVVRGEFVVVVLPCRMRAKGLTAIDEGDKQRDEQQNATRDYQTEPCANSACCAQP